MTAKETTGTNAERFMSLSQFSKDYGIPKGTLHRKAQELGLDTSNGLTKDMHDRLCLAFKVGPSETEVIEGEFINTEDVEVSSAIVPTSRKPISDRTLAPITFKNTSTNIVPTVERISAMSNFSDQASQQIIDSFSQLGAELGKNLALDLLELAATTKAQGVNELARSMGKQLGTVSEEGE